MPKTKEREIEKPSAKASSSSAKASSKASARSSSRTSVKTQTKSETTSRLAVKPAAKAAAKPSTRTQAAKAAPALVAKTAPVVAKTAPVVTKAAPAKSASAKSAPAKAIPVKAPVKVPEVFKSPFSKDELSKWRQVLLSRRSEISSDIAGLEKDAMEAEDGHTTPNHIAERGSDADLQDVSLGIAGEEKDIIWQIDRALRKIELQSPIPFGLCEYTKEPISRNRLQLIPWTPLSIEGANHMESNGLTVEDLLADE
jgi:RNA polymerase-binding transcription factor DksA